MKKKGIVILGGILIVAVFVVVICFVVFSGKSNATVTIDLNGTWYVYQYAEYKVENEFMVFENGKVSDYRDGSIEPYVSSTYTYEEDSLKMPDISKDFTVRIISDNNIILIEPDTKEWKMIRIASADKEVTAVTPSDLVGEYNVIMFAGEPRNNETMIFTDSMLTDIRDGKEYISCSYEIVSDNLLNALDIKKEYSVFKNGNILMLIDNADNYVWEMTEK